jgi:sialate O-acetylesterase
MMNSTSLFLTPQPTRKTRNGLRGLVTLLALGGLTPLATAANPFVHPLFANHMVLQRDKVDPVWGWTTAGNPVTVTVTGPKGLVQTHTTQADDQGRWQVKVGPFKAVANDEPYRIAVAAKGETPVQFEDVLIGDVFVCSGQSNMEFGIQTEADGAEAIRTATDSKIRFFFVPWATALTPQAGLAAVKAGSRDGQWQVCSPEVMGAKWAWNGFSAVGYYFAQDIRKSAGVPIGLIATYKGGTPAQSWTSVDGLTKDPRLGNYIADHEKLVANYETARLNYPQQQAEAQAKWKAAVAKWEQAKAEGKTVGGRPSLRQPTPADGGYRAPGNLFNGMIAPLVGFGIKGALWYQGESNADDMEKAREYAILFPRMIHDWREKWGQGDFPFLYVQLAAFKPHPAGAVEEAPWPILRENQLKTLQLPFTGMASAVDVGDGNNIHPVHKSTVGKRLALVARQVVYSEKVVASGPFYQAMTIQTDKIKIDFKQQPGNGLVIGVAPWIPEGGQPERSTTLNGFAIAGEDRKFVVAQAQIVQGSVIVSSPDVKNPVAVRYNWATNPVGNLYNPEGLPAWPFRTDAW